MKIRTERKKYIVVLMILMMVLFAAGCGKEEAAQGEVFDNKADAAWTLLTIEYPEGAGLENVVEYKVYSINGDTTPLDVLLSYGEATKTAVVTVDGPAKYVQGINGIFENDYMAPSGWVYTVNDEMVMEGASEFKLKPEDRITWSYVSFTDDMFS